MKILKELVKDVERDLVINLAVSVKHKRISFDESKVIAKEFISYFPFGNYEDLFERLCFMSSKYRDVRKVYVKYSPNYYDEKTQIVLFSMRKFIKEEDIDRALIIAKG